MKVKISVAASIPTRLHQLLTKFTKQTKYSELSPLYKKPLIERWKEFHDIVGDEPELNTLNVWYGRVPTKYFLNFLSSYPFYKEDHKTINDWHNWYSKVKTPVYNQQWAVLLWTESDEPLEDGWHRLNSYLVAGDPYIPVVFCPNSFKVLENL